MLKRHLSSRHRRRAAITHAVNHAAAGIISPLGLPLIDKSIRRRWEFNANNQRTLRLANLLVDAGLLTAGDLRPRHSLKDDIEASFAARFTAARPRPLAELGVNLTDDIADLNVEWHRYAHTNNLPEEQLNTGEGGKDGKLDEQFMGAFTVGFNISDSVHIEVIGPALNALEAWPQLGQSVLHILETGLVDCTRCLSPGTSLSWASRQYWMGEDDDTMRIEEELEDIRSECHAAAKKAGRPIPTDEEIIANDIQIFTRAKFEKSIPAHWHRNRKPLERLPLTLGTPDLAAVSALLHQGQGLTLAESFRVEAIKQSWPAIYAACENILKKVKAPDHDDNNPLCEQVAWEATPFLLRMHDDDCLGQIFDDAINGYFESGECDLNLNAVFLWHDAATLNRAMTRCTHYLELTQACEDVIRLLTPKEPIKIPVRV